MTSLVAHLLFAFTIAGEPAIGVWLHRRLARTVSRDARARRRFYAAVLAVEWAWVPLVLVAVWQLADPLRTLGITWPVAAGWGAVFTVAMVVIITLQTGVMVVLGGRLLQNPAAAKALESVQLILPRTRAEQWWWAGVSVTAGVCEELLYRGFLFYYLQSVLGLGMPATVALSSALFGLAHIYQGPRAALTGAVLSTTMGVVYAVTGSLLIPVALHVVMDLRSVLLSRHLPP